MWDNALFVNAVTRADIGLGESYMNGDFSFESGKGLSQSPHSATLIAHTRLTFPFLQSAQFAFAVHDAIRTEIR